MNDTITLGKKVPDVGSVFDEEHILHELKHYLPSQTPLKDFIHHNSLHAFQSMKFYDAIFKASNIFGYQATMELNDYRKLFEIGRIRSEILDKIIVDAKKIWCNGRDTYYQKITTKMLQHV